MVALPERERQVTYDISYLESNIQHKWTFPQKRKSWTWRIDLWLPDGRGREWEGSGAWGYQINQLPLRYFTTLNCKWPITIQNHSHSCTYKWIYPVELQLTPLPAGRTRTHIYLFNSGFCFCKQGLFYGHSPISSMVVFLFVCLSFCHFLGCSCGIWRFPG